MKMRWYYMHAGKTYGPIEGQAILTLVGRGELLATDLLWREGQPRNAAITAECAISFPAPGAPRARVPDWLEDVRLQEETPPAAVTPDWLDDVRQLEAPPPSSPPIASPTNRLVAVGRPLRSQQNEAHHLVVHHALMTGFDAQEGVVVALAQGLPVKVLCCLARVLTADVGIAIDSSSTSMHSPLPAAAVARALQEAQLRVIDPVSRAATALALIACDKAVHFAVLGPGRVYQFAARQLTGVAFDPALQPFAPTSQPAHFELTMNTGDWLVAAGAELDESALQEATIHAASPADLADRLVAATAATTSIVVLHWQ
jgi:hypothetical protein